MGIVKKSNPDLLKDDFCCDNKEFLSKSWAKSLLGRMGYVKQREMNTAKVYPGNFDNQQKSFLEEIQSEYEDVLFDLIFNWDQTGLNYVPVSNWTMEKEGAKCVEIKDLVTKGR